MYSREVEGFEFKMCLWEVNSKWCFELNNFYWRVYWNLFVNYYGVGVIINFFVFVDIIVYWRFYFEYLIFIENVKVWLFVLLGLMIC